MELKICECCGQKTLDQSGFKFYSICPVCHWQDDPIQNDDPDYAGGANSISLNEARKGFSEGKDIRELEAIAHKRYKARVEAAKKIAETRGEEFYEGETDRYLEEEAGQKKGL